MNIYVCFYKTGEEAFYIGADTPAEAKEYYANEMDCRYIDVRYYTAKKNGKCGYGFLTEEECNKNGLEVQEE